MTSRATRFPSAETLAAELPAGFVLGVATGGFTTADVAADQLRRLDEDIDLVNDLGVESYRFSFSWPRVQPGGSGRLNRASIAFYDRLVDRLLSDGISPMATLFTWDTPLELPGGWQSRDTARRLGEMAFRLGELFGDRIDSWVTVDEPATVMLNGHALGREAPGETLRLETLRLDGLGAARNLLLGHGCAVEGLRGAGVRGLVGIANVYTPVEPATSDDDDTAFARLFDTVHNRIFADPVFFGRYPDVPEEFAGLLDGLVEVDSSDLALISQPLDFYGLNYRAPTRIAASIVPSSLAFHAAPWPELDRTGSGEPISPEHLATSIVELAARYGDVLPPIVITSVGASFPESVVLDERTGQRVVADPRRIEYLTAHLEAALTATRPGGPAASVDLRGYHVSTFLNGAEGQADRSRPSGLVHVDRGTLERTPKDSFRWLQALSGDRRR